MSDLDHRLAAWNPVRAEDSRQAGSSTAAVHLLASILKQQRDLDVLPQETRDRRLRVWVWFPAVAALIVIVVAIAAAMPSSRRPGLAGQPAIGFQHGPSVGIAADAAELVAYATRSSAGVPVIVPSPRNWEYFERYYGPSTSAGRSGTGDAQTWQQVGTYRFAASWHHGKLTHGTGGGPEAQLTGWPGVNWTTMYRYLATLPAQPAALRKIILENNHANAAAAFFAIAGVFANFPVPARFQAELYAVLVTLPGVAFTSHAVDAAGRQGVGLYTIEDGAYLQEIIVNPRTYAYMGGFEGTLARQHPANEVGEQPRIAIVSGNVAILNSGIVSRPGQIP